MCGFTITNKNVSFDQINNRLVSLRGPDKTTFKTFKDFKFCHHLLSITGHMTEQPFIDEDEEIIAIYNGEIYNYKLYNENATSDGQCLIPLYKKHGMMFVNKLDGEFALILIDFKNKLIVISGDLFKTKPLFYSVENSEFSASSYRNSLVNLGCKTITDHEPNKAVVFNLSGDLLYTIRLFNFDIDNQDKTDMSGWEKKFDNAISKRATTDKSLFIGLSSGYDSGAIACSLVKQNKKFKCYSVHGSENDHVLNMRHELLRKSGVEVESILKTKEDYNIAHSYIVNNTDAYSYNIRNTDGSYVETTNLTDDSGSNWLSSICQRARLQNYKIILSGMGADEIISDYGYAGHRHFPHSNFGGKFPENLREIFPWPSFYGSTMKSYISKEEYVGGSYGIETRYPFLDKEVVQEFLWLHPSVKNSCYKSVISHYLESNNFPFERGIKRGF